MRLRLSSHPVPPLTSDDLAAFARSALTARSAPRLVSGQDEPEPRSQFTGSRMHAGVDVAKLQLGEGLTISTHGKRHTLQLPVGS
jgi:hypothetical protein